jgi:hypothetical protein
MAAGAYGLVVLTPFLFLERQIAAPARGLDHPEYFYGFLLIGIAWQLLFLLIAREPVRLRPAMIVAALVEKLPFAIIVPALWLQGRVQAPVVAFSSLDLIWGALFTVAWLRTPKA